jgi:hypothetical protein
MIGGNKEKRAEKRKKGQKKDYRKALKQTDHK